MFYIFLNKMLWKFHSGLPLSPCTLNKFWKVIREVCILVQVQTHAADSGIARIECPGSQEADRFFASVGSSSLAAQFEGKLYNTQRKIWAEHLHLFLSTQFVSSSVFPSFSCSLNSMLLVGLMQWIVHLLWLAFCYSDSSSGLSQLLMMGLLQFDVTGLIFIFLF